MCIKISIVKPCNSADFPRREALGSSVNRGNGSYFSVNPPLESHPGAYTCFLLYGTFVSKRNQQDWREIRKGVKGMHVSIRRYGLLTREPVEKVLQGVREGFIPIIKISQDSWPITRWI